MPKPSAEIYLMKNIPLKADYEHSIDFKDASEQYAFFRGYVSDTLLDYTYVRKEREYIVVGLTMEELDDVNYLMFRSEQDGRLYFAFVVNKVYVNANATQVFYQIDVIQTYMFDYSWKPSYILQGHVDRWTADHKPIYSMTDEGLAYGSEYSVESAHAIRQSESVVWALIAMKDYSEIATEGAIVENTANNPLSSPFAFLLVPIKKDSNGGAIVVEDREVGDFNNFTTLMLKTALGNYVQSVSLLPYNPLLMETNPTSFVAGQGVSIDFVALGNLQTGTAGSRPTYYDTPFVVVKSTNEQGLFFKRVLARADWNIGLENTLPTEEEWSELKSKPRTTPRDKRFESKLLCAPYRYNLLTDWRNQPTIFKNEYLPDDKLEVLMSTTLSHNAPFRYWLKDYKRDPEGRYTSLVQPLSMDMPIISDVYATYMLQNKNTIETNVSNAMISGAVGAVSSAVSGGMTGGPVGAILGALGAGVSSATNIVTMVRSENAKQQDLRTHPDTIINSNDSSMNVNDKNTEVTWYRMRICCMAEEILGEIFAMSGYKVNRVDVPNTRSRVRYNYLQTLGANIVGSFNQADLLRIKEIYDKGITLWHYSDKDFNLFDYSYENIEVNLL